MSGTPLTSAQAMASAGGATLNSTGANLLTVWGINMPPGFAIIDSVGGNNNNAAWQAATLWVNGTYRLQFWWVWNPTFKGASHNFTDSSGGVSGNLIHATAWSCSATFDTLAADVGFTDPGVFGGTSVASGSATPSGSPALVMSACLANGGSAFSGFSVNSGLTMLQSSVGPAPGGASAYINQATAAAINPQFSWTGYAGRIIGATVALKAAGGGGGGGSRLFRNNPSGMLAGVGSSGPFFQNPLQRAADYVKRRGIFVPRNFNLQGA